MGGVRGGHGNHQASGFLTPKAVELAADAKAYPGTGAPWKVGLLLQQGGRGGNGATVTLPVNDISPIWGESYGEIGRRRICKSAFTRRRRLHKFPHF